MYAQPPPYGPQPQPYDPVSTQVMPPQAPAPHTNPLPQQPGPVPRRGLSGPAFFSLLACLLAAAALLIVTVRAPHTGPPAEVSKLSSQVHALQQQHGRDVTTAQDLTQQLAGLSRQYAALSDQINGMTTTVKNMKPYDRAVCTISAIGPNGAYAAGVPCAPK